MKPVYPKFSILGEVMTWQSKGIHYSDVIMSAMVSQTTSVSIVCSAVYSGANQRKHQSSASLAFVRGIHRWPVNSPHKRPVTRKIWWRHQQQPSYWPCSVGMFRSQHWKGEGIPRTMYITVKYRMGGWIFVGAVGILRWLCYQQKSNNCVAFAACVA